MSFHQENIEALARCITSKDSDLDERIHLKKDLYLTSFDMMLLIAFVEHSTDKEVDLEALSQDMTIGGLLHSLK